MAEQTKGDQEPRDSDEIWDNSALKNAGRLRTPEAKRARAAYFRSIGRNPDGTKMSEEQRAEIFDTPPAKPS